MPIIDVSVPLDRTLPSYPNNLPFSLDPVKRLARGDSSNVSALHMSAHSGTHVDAPRHFFDEGTGTEALPLDLLVGVARVVEVRPQGGITADDLRAVPVSGAVRLLIKTQNSALWDDPQFHREYVGVTESGARYLVECGVTVVGVDYLSVEVFRAPGAPAHRVLLGAGTAVIEGLDLRQVEPGEYEMLCLPLRIVGSDGAPARVVLRRD
jgi:arylformamidase